MSQQWLAMSELEVGHVLKVFEAEAFGIFDFEGSAGVHVNCQWGEVLLLGVGWRRLVPLLRVPPHLELRG